ncbi:MAG: TRAP transporter small permease [Defluviicoccus sp.]|nr:TRAP transporter small permease [Defluviicoccus sp.]
MLVKHLFQASDRLAVWTIRGGGGLMFIAALMIAVDVVLRKVVGVTLGGADELAGYAMAIGCTWSFSYVLLRRGNVRVDALYNHLPPKVCIALDLLAVVAIGGFVAVLAFYGFDVFSTSWGLGSRSNSELKMPLWLPQGLWWLGLVQVVLTAVILLLRALALLRAGKTSDFRALVGARSIEEDAAAEAAYTRTHEGECLKETT